jgi:hypothetical protein
MSGTRHPMTDGELLSRLHLQCGMKFRLDATPAELEAMLAFGRWLLERHHPAGWHESFASEQWGIWEAEMEQAPMASSKAESQ